MRGWKAFPKMTILLFVFCLIPFIGTAYAGPASFTISPMSGAPKGAVTFYGAGFQPGEMIEIIMVIDDVPTDLVDQAVALTPGIESPTVSPLHREGWVAVRAMVPRAQTNQVMDALWSVGARGILVTDIHACRL